MCTVLLLVKFRVERGVFEKQMMTDGPTTKTAYFRVCSETGRDPDGEILAVINHAIDEQIL